MNACRPGVPGAVQGYPGAQALLRPSLRPVLCALHARPWCWVVCTRLARQSALCSNTKSQPECASFAGFTGCLPQSTSGGAPQHVCQPVLSHLFAPIRRTSRWRRTATRSPTWHCRCLRWLSPSHPRCAWRWLWHAGCGAHTEQLQVVRGEQRCRLPGALALRCR